MKLISIVGIAVLVLVLMAGASSATVTVTPATDGSSIPADNYSSGLYTTLAGPIIAEGTTAEIGSGTTIILNAPSGFMFNTASSVIATVTAGNLQLGTTNANKASTETATVTNTTITTNVYSKSTGSGASTIRWTGIQVRPTAGTPLASGNINKTGTSIYTASNTNYGTLTEVAGAPSKLVFTSSPVTVTAGVASSSITVQRQDQYNNPNTTGAARTVTLSSDSTGTVTFNPTSLTIGSGSSSATFTYTDTKAGTPTITASSTSPTTITSATQQETVNNPVPTTTSISPSSKTVGDAQFTMNVTGTNFVSGSVVQFNGASRTTTYLNSTALSATIPATDMATAGTSSITVFNPTPGGGTSTGQTFTVNKATPTITFGTAPTPTYLGGNFTVSATTNNTDNGTVTYSYVSGPCAFVSGSNFSSSGAGTCVVQASGVVTTNFTAASAQQSVTIAKATPTLWVSNSPVTYNGAAQSANFSASVGGIASNVLYNSSSTVPSSAGNYTVTANFAPTDSTNYSNLTNAAAGNFIINKATPILSVNNSPVTYTGSAQSATVSSGSVTGTVSNILTGGAASQTNAGTYAVTANFASTDSNYNSTTNAAAGNFIINKATPTLSVTNSPVNYTGSAQSATVSSSYSINEGDTLYIDVNYTDLDSDPGTFDDNATQ
ncbi:MAG: MBG domain-containing protein [Candidatus Methanoperedens sp.]